MTNNLVILPTYNEEANVSKLIHRILKYISDVDILIVDGASIDATEKIVREIAVRNSKVHFLKEDKKSGLGKAYLTGFNWGLANGYSKLIEMDCDLSHRVRDLVNLLQVKEYDLVIGSRWIKGGHVENWSRQRKRLSRFANKYVEFFLKLGIADSTSGFRVYSSELLENIDFNSIKSEGYAFQIEMTLAARKLDAKIVEVPIIFREREFGKSKISRAIVFEAMFRVTVWGLRRIGGGGGI